MGPRVLYVIVNYFNETEIQGFIIQQLLKQNAENIFIVLMDNGHSPRSKLNQLVETIPNMAVVDSGGNIGYMPPTSKALQYYCQKFGVEPDFVFLTNTDIQIKNNAMISNLTRKYINTNDIGIIAPCIISTRNGKMQNPMYESRLHVMKLNFLIALTHYSLLYNIYIFGAWVKGKMLAKNTTKLDVHSIYAAHGCFMIFHKNFFTADNRFDRAPFLYGEELYTAEICRLKKLKVIYDSSETVLHKEHTTTGFFRNKKHLNYLRNSLSYIKQTFYASN